MMIGGEVPLPCRHGFTDPTLPKWPRGQPGARAWADGQSGIATPPGAAYKPWPTRPPPPAHTLIIIVCTTLDTIYLVCTILDSLLLGWWVGEADADKFTSEFQNCWCVPVG